MVKGKFEAHFVVKRNVIFERAKFNLRSQQDGESVDNFMFSGRQEEDEFFPGELTELSAVQGITGDSWRFTE